MLVIKAPLRVSFIGGGTDFPSFFNGNKNGGSVFGTSISKYVYVMIEHQPEFEETKFRVTYRVTDSSQSIRELKHPVVRETLAAHSWSTPLNIATMANLPGRSGLGSSSAFTVALNHGLNNLRETKNDSSFNYLMELALSSINIERNLLQEYGGYQDQFHASFGGMRRYQFRSSGISIGDPIQDDDFLSLMSDSLYLVANKTGRESKTHAQETDFRIREGKLQDELIEMTKLSNEVASQLESNTTSALSKFAILIEGMREGWELKLKTGVKLDSQILKQIGVGKLAGASAWKLCGAGGTGFMAFLVEKQKQASFESAFDPKLIFKPRLSRNGVELHEM